MCSPLAFVIAQHFFFPFHIPSCRSQIKNNKQNNCIHPKQQRYFHAFSCPPLYVCTSRLVVCEKNKSNVLAFSLSLSCHVFSVPAPCFRPSLCAFSPCLSVCPPLPDFDGGDNRATPSHPPFPVRPIIWHFSWFFYFFCEQHRLHNNEVSGISHFGEWQWSWKGWVNKTTVSTISKALLMS